MMVNKYKLLMIILFACGMVSQADAQPVSQDAAAVRAMDFFTCRAQTHSGCNAPRKAPQLQLVSDGEGYYIFNDVVNGGFVIIGGDERMEQVLAYSFTGGFNIGGVIPCNVQSVLDSYADEASYLRAHPQYTPPHRMRRRVDAVAPLLGETAWDQNWPYNLMTPVIDGKHCVTGCVATAAAQVMYYHRWPARGQGQVSYDWNGTTLEVDLSQSEYQWDLMTPRYSSSSSTESCYAVALLMRDVGYACHMNYGLGGSSAGGSATALVTNFDYDKGILWLGRDNCNAAVWDSIIVDELAHQRPLQYSGRNSQGGHALVIDGIDNNGYYHFNFGWGGFSNGYYTLSTISFNSSPSISFGIQKNKGGNPRVLIGSNIDFFYDEGTDALIWRPVVMQYFGGATYNIVFAIEDTLSHQVIYAPKGKQINIDLADGYYEIYPVVKYGDEDNYRLVFFHEDRQTKVDLIVKDGVKTYQNNHITDTIQDGAVEIDGIYYFLNHDRHEATVTFRNERYGSYSGDVTIPEQVEYQDETFQVTNIGRGAFYYCNLGCVAIPKTMKHIQSAFHSASVEEIIFAPESQLQYINAFAFNYCIFNKGFVDLPEGLLRLLKLSFQCTEVKCVSLPSSLLQLADETFNTALMRSLVVKKKSPLKLSSSPIYGIDPALITMYVPIGSGEAYRQADYWKDFGQIVEGDVEVIENGGLYYQINNDAGTAAFISAYGAQSSTLEIPSSITHQGKRFTVVSIHPHALNISNSPIREVTIPSTVKYIGEGAFNCSNLNLNILKMRSRVPIAVADKTLNGKLGFYPFFYSNYFFKQVPLHVPMGSKALYKADSFWGQFTKIVEDCSLGRSLDVNSDGAVNIADINKLINDILTGNNNGDTLEDDVNGDGVINISDLNVIIDYILAN